MLKDEVTITVKSGNGGRGCLATNLNFAVGGDGGRGGDIYLLGSENVYDLSGFDDQAVYKGGRGEDGHGKRRTGSDGADLVLQVPLTTELHLRNRVPIKIEKHGQKALVMRGGRGGYGSISARKNPDEELSVEPENGKAEQITLILKLLSDVIFIGYPNAGKSSMLNALTDAEVKVAAYEFTTLEPQLGLMEGIRLMDLPGLIEGTFEGRGLGTRFVKHTESCRLIAHFVSMESPDPVAVYKTLRNEIKNIDEKLYNKPELIVLSKTDESEPAKVAEMEAEFKAMGLPVVSASVIDDVSLAEVRQSIKAQLSKIS